MNGNNDGTTAAYAYQAAYTAQQTADLNAADVAYLHARVDQLIRQTALEAGLNDRTRLNLPKERWNDAVNLAKNRFWAADDAVAEAHGRTSRRHGIDER